MVQGAEIKELKEFTTKLKSLPQIQRHIDLLSHLQTIFNKPVFGEKIQLQHTLLGDPVSDSEYQMIEVKPFRSFCLLAEYSTLNTYPRKFLGSVKISDGPYIGSTNI